MIRAAATGRIDYSEADSTNVVWLTRERLMVEETERDALINLAAFKQLQQVATAGGPSAGNNDLFKTHYDRGNEHLKMIGQTLFPYIKWDEQDRVKSEMAQVKAEYKEVFGDPNTPEAKARAKRDMETVKRQQLMAVQKVKADAEHAQKLLGDIERLRSKRVKPKR